MDRYPGRIGDYHCSLTQCRNTVPRPYRTQPSRQISQTRTAPLAVSLAIRSARNDQDFGSVVAQPSFVRPQRRSEDMMRSIFTKFGPNCDPLNSDPLAHGWYTWLGDAFFFGTPNHLELFYPVSRTELAMLPRAVLARIYRELTSLATAESLSEALEAGEAHNIINHEEMIYAQCKMFDRIGAILGKPPMYDYLF